MLVKDFYAPSVGAARELVRYGYREFEVDPNMVVPLRPEWRSFDDYTGAMTGKYRSRARSARRKARALERRVLDENGILEHHSRIRELFDAVHQKARFRIAALPPDYSPALKSALGEGFKVLGYWLDERLVGFTSFLEWGDRLEGHFLGLDYDHNAAHCIYQNILYDDIVEGLRRGSCEIYLGRTALEMKSAIGAEPRPVKCYLRHRNPASNAVVRPLFHFVKPTQWTKRNPFEDGGASSRQESPGDRALAL